MVVQGLLESAGIDAELGDAENSQDVLPVGGIGLLVRQEDAARALQVIEEYRRSPEQDHPPPPQLGLAKYELSQGADIATASTSSSVSCRSGCTVIATVSVGYDRVPRYRATLFPA